MTLSSNAPNKNYLTRKTFTVHCPHLNQIHIVGWWWLSHVLNIYLRGRRQFPTLTTGYIWNQLQNGCYKNMCNCSFFFSFSLVDGIVNVSIRNLFGYLVFCIVFFELFVNFLQCFCFVFTIQKWETNNSY